MMCYFRICESVSQDGSWGNVRLIRAEGLVSESSFRTVKSAARTVRVLELLAAYPDGLTLSQLCEELRIPFSSMYDLAGTLTHLGFLLRDETTLLYRLGPKMLQLAGKFWASQDLVNTAAPIMAEIREQTGETTSLSVLQDQLIVFIHKAPARGVVQVVNPVGTRLPAHSTGSGKAMLAHLPEADLLRLYPDEALEKATPATIATRRELFAALKKARSDGYAEDQEESQIGVWAVASCIRNALGEPLAAISIAAPAFRVQARDPGHWAELLVDGAARISSLFGFRKVP